jgi:hypothetical protein
MTTSLMTTSDTRRLCKPTTFGGRPHAPPLPSEKAIRALFFTFYSVLLYVCFLSSGTMSTEVAKVGEVISGTKIAAGLISGACAFGVM